MNNENEFLRMLYGYRKPCVEYLLGKTNCNITDAENIFIEAVIDLKRKKSLEDIMQIRNLNTFLLRVCFNHWKRFYYTEKKKVDPKNITSSYFYNYQQDSHDDEEINKMEEELLELSNKALHSLDGKCQEIIKYFYYQNKTMTEIASLMGFNTPAVATTAKYRCIKKLRDLAFQIKKKNEEI